MRHLFVHRAVWPLCVGVHENQTTQMKVDISFPEVSPGPIFNQLLRSLLNSDPQGS